jgi:hypothetical protein
VKRYGKCTATIVRKKRGENDVTSGHETSNDVMSGDATSGYILKTSNEVFQTLLFEKDTGK